MHPRCAGRGGEVRVVRFDGGAENDRVRRWSIGKARTILRINFYPLIFQRLNDVAVLRLVCAAVTAADNKSHIVRGGGKTAHPDTADPDKMNIFHKLFCSGTLKKLEKIYFVYYTK